jgi:glycosyltransferase involved in cell wall biosynthesis
MRVLHVIPSLSPAHGGPSFALPVMERALTRLAITVETVTTDDDGPGKRNAKAKGTALAENGVTRRYFPKQTEFYKFSLPLYRWLRSEVGRFDAVHVHAVFSFSSVAAAWLARRAGVPYVIRPLGVLNRYGITQRRSLLKRFSVRAIEGPLLRDAAAVHFTSRQEQTEAEALKWPLRSVVIPLGLEPPVPGTDELFLSLHPGIRNRRRVLFLSRLDQKKNVECLLQAFAEARNDFSDLALIVCGEGSADYTGQLKGLARTLGISEAVVWAGDVQGELKQSAFSCGDVFVLPSFSENFGIAAVEALFAGLPCVLSQGVAIAAEVACAKAGAAVEPTPAAVADGIRFYLGNAGARMAAGRNAKQIAGEKYSAAAMGGRLAELYHDITSKGLARIGER